MAITHLLYLHGFRSSPLSAKAQFLTQWMSTHRPHISWHCPQLPVSPLEAQNMLQRDIEHWPHHQMVVIGSSLGGYYATWIASHYQCKAVLLNPAIEPARDLKKYIGEHPVWQNPEEKIYFKPQYIDELQNMYVQNKNLPTSIMTVIAKGDEVLDWKEMTGRYPQSHIKLLEQSDHGLTDFEDHWPDILKFLDLA